jgi:hypothetical protein
MRRTPYARKAATAGSQEVAQESRLNASLDGPSAPAPIGTQNIAGGGEGKNDRLHGNAARSSAASSGWGGSANVRVFTSSTRATWTELLPVPSSIILTQVRHRRLA